MRLGREKQPLWMFPMDIYGFKRKMILLALFLTLLSVVVPARRLEISEEELDAFYNLIEWNLYYARAENLNGYRSTIHPGEPSNSDTQVQMAVIFREFDLAYNIEEWEILSMNTHSVQGRVVQVTRKLSGSQSFSNNRIEALHHLRQDSTGAWKIYTSTLNEDSIEFFDIISP
jgi:hypothetical protein